MDQNNHTTNVHIQGDRVIAPIGDNAQVVIHEHPPEISAQELLNRQNMLKLVENTWIDGLLKKSLYNQVLIELGMQTQPDAIEHPWDTLVQTLDRKPEPLPQGIMMVDVFDQLCGLLLILGEPGSGKTTMLLELTRQLIERTDRNSVPLMPVVFNLSSWTPAQKFSDWLVNELRSKNYTPEKIAAAWVDGDKLILLLDGLDEVTAENRIACIQAVNDYRSQHAVSFAVCSRRQEYEDLAQQCKLRVQGAVLIQEMDDRQVAEYLGKAGSGLQAVHQLLKRDANLQEFARTPLILSILVLTYRNAEEKTLKSLEGGEDYRKRLFSDYIEQMFKHRPGSKEFTSQETRHCLHWMACMMLSQGQSMFSVEDVGFRVLTVSYNRLKLIVRLRGEQDVKLKPTDQLHWSWQEARGGLIVGLIVGLTGGFIFGLSSGLIGGLIFGLIVGLRYGGVFSIQHYIFRFLLYRSGSLPWQLIPFLEHCTDLIFLRRVGGSYIFIHRMLLEHFADMDKDMTAVKEPAGY